MGQGWRARSRPLRLGWTRQCSGIIDKHEMARYLPFNPTILEAGAHDDSDTVDMLRVWPKATVRAFEPVPEIFARLQQRTAAIDSVHT